MITRTLSEGPPMAARVNYRKLAFAHYDPLCAHCGFGISSILEVAHIDGNRQNNDVANLVILCPNCKKMLKSDLISIDVIFAMRKIAMSGSGPKRLNSAVAAKTRRRNLQPSEESSQALQQVPKDKALDRHSAHEAGLRSQTTTATNAASKPELVFDLGAEGGQSSIYRTRDAKGYWVYAVVGGGMSLDENDHEAWQFGSSGSFNSFEEALNSITGDFWVYLYPLAIHPEYRKIVWFELQKIVSKFSVESLKNWYMTKDRWQEMCNEYWLG